MSTPKCLPVALKESQRSDSSANRFSTADEYDHSSHSLVQMDSLMKTFEELSLAEPEPQSVREGDTNDHREERVEADSVPPSQDLCGLGFTRMEYFIGVHGANVLRLQCNGLKRPR